MRRRFDVQLALGQTPIERVSLPLKSRDELPPILAGLQWIFETPEINEQIFELLEAKVVAGKKATGRPGLDLWQILVLGVVRLGLDCDYDCHFAGENQPPSCGSKPATSRWLR